MTKGKAKTLVKALEKAFGGRAECEAINDVGRYRFGITTERFENMPHLKRQDAIWKVVDKTLSGQDLLDVSLVLAYAPSDMTAAT